MNIFQSSLFLAQAIGPAGDKGTSLVVWLTAFCCVVLVAIGAISFAAHQNIIAIGFILGAVVVASLGVPFVNFLFAGIPVHITAGNVNTILFLWR